MCALPTLARAPPRVGAQLSPRYDPTEGLAALRICAHARARLPRPVPPDCVEAVRSHIRFDGRTRDGEPVLLAVMSRQLQEALLADPEVFVRGSVGLLEAALERHFVRGRMETVQTVVQVERGFRLSLQAMPLAASQRVLSVLTEAFPSVTSRILIVNLPPYLAWFVNFVKGMLCEGSAAKIELVGDFATLRAFYEPGGVMPSYYRERSGIKP